jgi:L-threonylcarbamoyladenylate synthase
MPLLDGHDAQAVQTAAAALMAGELVAFPTETVYGLGARADDDAAVARIFAAKGRPADHPLIVHVPDAAAAARFTPALDGAARVLVEAFWPGPLTVIVPRRAGIAARAAGGQPSIGLRCPSHPVARALLHAAQRLGVAGVAAPSANRFGRLSPTCAAHVVAEFGPALRVLDGGPCALGIESTIVDCTRAQPVLLRPGTLPRAAVEQALGGPLRERDALAPRAPGTLASHYAPRASLRLMDAAALRAALAALGPPGSGPSLAVYSISACPQRHGLLQRRMPGDAAAAAHELFAVLRGFDDAGVQQIWVETPPAGDEWAGVRDRLQRAAA